MHCSYPTAAKVGLRPCHLPSDAPRLSGNSAVTSSTSVSWTAVGYDQCTHIYKGFLTTHIYGVTVASQYNDEENLMSNYTLGEYRVGITFNPSDNPAVDVIKRQAAELIDEIEDIKKACGSQPEVVRLCALAQTAFEEGAMWAVKAITKETR